MSYPLVRDLAAEGIPVRLTCGVLGHSRQAYYAWLADPISQRELEDAHLTNALIVAMGVDQGVGQVGVLEVALADRSDEPGVVRLAGVAQHPAGQPHGDPLGGQVTDQRVAHFGSEPAAK